MLLLLPAHATPVELSPLPYEWPSPATPRPRPRRGIGHRHAAATARLESRSQPAVQAPTRPATLGSAGLSSLIGKVELELQPVAAPAAPLFAHFPQTALTPGLGRRARLGLSWPVLALRKGQTSQAGYCAPARLGPTRSLSILVSATGCVVSISRWEARGARWSEAPRGALTAPSLGGRLAASPD